MIVIPQRFVNMGECWFDDEPESGVDVINFVQVPKQRASYFTKFYTIVIYLSKTPEEILGAMCATSRNEIRRAESKDSIRHEWISDPSEESIDTFCSFYDDFAHQKSINPLSKQRIRAYAKYGLLRFSKTFSPDDTLLSWNAFIENRKRLRWLWGPSLYRNFDDKQFRQMVGRASRFNHYCCMLQAKMNGDHIYDLGGWHPGKTNQSLLAVNKFKEGLGGELLIEYSGFLPVTFRGKAYMAAQNIRQRFKHK